MEEQRYVTILKNSCINYRSYIELEGEVLIKIIPELTRLSLTTPEKMTAILTIIGICEEDLIKNNIMKKQFFFKDIPVCYMNSKKQPIFSLKNCLTIKII